MKAVGIKALKDKLSEYVRRAAAGETILVTDRDRVVAELGPPAPGRSATSADAFRAEAIRNGWVTPAQLPLDAPPPRRPVAALDVVLRGLDADRADR